MIHLTYKLYKAITLNASGIKYNVIAAPISLIEISKHAAQFSFDFALLYRKGNIIYKLFKEDEPDMLQGMVAFLPSTGFLQCKNMEINAINKKPLIFYSGVGNAMVALCCKVSFDLGFGGYIGFDAKNKLFDYYKRCGAIHLGGIKFAIEENEAAILINKYF